MPDSSPAKALVVGATGVIGRHIVERLLQEPMCEVVGLSRRALPARAGYTHLAVDLLDDTATAQALAQVSGITYVFFAGFAPAGGVAAD
jgi:nucleoside-diphosphate-sugar epimerase